MTDHDRIEQLRQARARRLDRQLDDDDRALERFTERLSESPAGKLPLSIVSNMSIDQLLDIKIAVDTVLANRG